MVDACRGSAAGAQGHYFVGKHSCEQKGTLSVWKKAPVIFSPQVPHLKQLGCHFFPNAVITCPLMFSPHAAQLWTLRHFVHTGRPPSMAHDSRSPEAATALPHLLHVKQFGCQWAPRAVRACPSISRPQPAQVRRSRQSSHTGRPPSILNTPVSMTFEHLLHLKQSRCQFLSMAVSADSSISSPHAAQNTISRHASHTGCPSSILNSPPAALEAMLLPHFAQLKQPSHQLLSMALMACPSICLSQAVQMRFVRHLSQRGSPSSMKQDRAPPSVATGVLHLLQVKHSGCHAPSIRLAFSTVPTMGSPHLVQMCLAAQVLCSNSPSDSVNGSSSSDFPHLAQLKHSGCQVLPSACRVAPITGFPHASHLGRVPEATPVERRVRPKQGKL
mmetsp:Transcript_62982/g.103989  ORF Transcript_62982/g.103989 Transcript_62982/m.103989 type:complete len:387 (-) Transcript_62982:265-1425(-)